ncbi:MULTISPECIES: glycine zipper 2TM domain-containing protein [Sphingomonadaceae]|uniref:glycine zipper 2TM domain-containing protein n=1 Tax=Sphingomonadales TaxID=204457 RepID=UPI00077044A3|nr:17 kDa surface antigen [Sphingobium sp. TKS]
MSRVSLIDNGITGPDDAMIRRAGISSKTRGWTIAFSPLALAALPLICGPALAQSAADQRRWTDAQDRYRAEVARYEAERDRYEAVVRADHPDAAGRRGDPYATDYDAARHYRDDPRYGERRLSDRDEVYRGSDGRYYCKRSDGTTGLIVGAAGGGILGNIIDGGRHRAAGTLIGGALGALAGRSIEQNDIRCR